VKVIWEPSPGPDDPIWSEGPRKFSAHWAKRHLKSKTSKENAMPSKVGTLADWDRLGIPRREYVISRPHARPSAPSHGNVTPNTPPGSPNTASASSPLSPDEPKGKAGQ
jgi:hypothetical protein